MPTTTAMNRTSSPIQMRYCTFSGMAQKPQVRSTVGIPIMTQKISAARSVISGAWRLRQKLHNKLLIIVIPRFSQNVPQVAHYKIHQPFGRRPLKKPCSYGTNRKCCSIVDGDLYPLISHYQSSLKDLMRNAIKTPSAISIATPHPAINRPKIKHRKSIIFTSRKETYRQSLSIQRRKLRD